MTIFERTIRRQGEAILNLLLTVDQSQFDLAVKALGYSKIIFTLGVGKSKPIAEKIADTFTSIGSPALCIRTEQLLHGSLSLLFLERSCLLIVSKSGETNEIINVISALEENPTPVKILITSRADSTLAKNSDILLLYDGEECCGTNFIPTTSTTLSLVIGDALAMTLMKKNALTLEQFAQTHPGGSLGRVVRDSLGKIEFSQ